MTARTRGVADYVAARVACGDAPIFGRRPAERLGRATGSSLVARAGQRVDVVGAVLTLVIVAVIAYVGLDVVGEVEDSTSISGKDNDPQNRSELANASVSLDQGLEGAFGIMGVVFLVILLAVIIGLFVGLRQR
jgi:hypothetical protein